MYRFTLVLMIVPIVAIASFAVQAESDEGEAATEKSRIPGWFRVDTDSLGTHFLIGATHSVGGLSLESNIFIDDALGEFDLGVSIPAVKGDGFSLTLLPMLGLGFEYAVDGKPSPDGPLAIYPHLFVFMPAGNFFLKSWTIGTLKSVFDAEKNNEVYTRNYVTYSLNKTLAIGPQVEAVIVRNPGTPIDVTVSGPDPIRTEIVGKGSDLVSFVVGLRINIGYGENNTLGILVGYDTKKTEEQTGLTGRLSFTRRW